jgi:hypothetical protein
MKHSDRKDNIPAPLNKPMPKEAQTGECMNLDMKARDVTYPNLLSRFAIGDIGE